VSDRSVTLCIIEGVATPAKRSPTLPREVREQRVLDAAADLFYARGVHEVGMDELVRATGLGKATVYRLFPTKDELVGAYLRRLSAEILAAIDADIAHHADDPATAVRAIVSAVAEDLARPTFRGCPFNNASIEFADPTHPGRIAARDYRAELARRLTGLSERIAPGEGVRLGAQLALLIDGMYVNAAHLGPDGPATAGPELAEALIANTRV
jgi:AcrR family transcriptional regulator